jgi:hypothetical protein
LIGDYRRILDGIHEKALHWQGFFITVSAPRFSIWAIKSTFDFAGFVRMSWKQNVKICWILR